MKYVYLIQSLDNGYYKIGVSNSPTIRLSSLQTGNSSEIKLINEYQSEFATKIERALQRKYSYCNKRGEWFELSIEDELNFMCDCDKINNNLGLLRKNNNIFIK